DDNDEEEIAKLDEQDDTESGEGDAEETKSDEESVEEEKREEEEETFDPIPRSPEETDLTEMELKKILIEKMEGNKSIQ
nr:hypothetical protein [Tanacetum cinerariifolium]